MYVFLTEKANAAELSCWIPTTIKWKRINNGSWSADGHTQGGDSQRAQDDHCGYGYPDGDLS